MTTMLTSFFSLSFSSIFTGTRGGIDKEEHNKGEDENNGDDEAWDEVTDDKTDEAVGQ